LFQVPWKDDLFYLQTQGYWTLANWRLFDRTQDERFRALAEDCSRRVLTLQRDDGGWDYPNPEWKGRTATTEGNWATIGLLETFRRTGDETYLDGALRWRRHLLEKTGFQRDGDELAVNYFAQAGQARVPNNSVTTLRVLAELADATGDPSYCDLYPDLFRFVQRVQRSSGELPYAVPGADGQGKGRPHFQCFQYNAFQCLNLMRRQALTGDSQAQAVAEKVLSFLTTGQDSDGHVHYQCGDRSRAVIYHTAAAAAAFITADAMGIAGYRDRAERAYAWVLNQQRADGSFPHSQWEHYVLSDRRSYPRYLAMILDHLLLAAPASGVRQKTCEYEELTQRSDVMVYDKRVQQSAL
jgi:hypothetical protein